MKKQLANVSPWILAAACTLLTFIIGAFAVNNYSREKALMMEALLQKGLAVMRFLDTGVRVSMRASWQNRTDSAVSWIEHVQGVIDQLHDQADIHFVHLINGEGEILAGTDAKQIGRKVDDGLKTFIRSATGGDPIFRVYLEKEDDHRGFQVARMFTPRLRGPWPMNMGQGRMMMDSTRRMVPEMERMQQELEELAGQELVLLVELDMAQFSSAVQRQLWQIGILSVVLLLVGVGGWLSLLTLQGFKGTQTRLQRIRAFSDMLVESLPVGLIATDGGGSIRMVNAAAEKIVGISADKLLNHLPAEVLPQLLVQPFAEPEKRQGGGPQSFEGVLETNEGQKRSLFMTNMSVADDQGAYTGDVLLIQDLSALRQLEAELRRNERLAALGKMAAGVAHELRNPLSSIKGLAVLLKGKISEDQEGRRTADVLVQEVERLNRSISELLDYARPEKLQVAVVSLKKILEKAATLVGIDATSLGITMSTAFDPAIDLVSVDEDRMNQVFLNLLLNGIQAMPEGGTLGIRTECRDGSVECVIEDNGEGIAEENLPRVFDPYFTTKSDGTGLGLALSAKIVEEHGGTISLDSSLGRGTRVTVRLPSAA